MGKNTRMQQFINYRIRVTIDDSRMLVGTFMAFDRHMNIVLADAEEFRRIKSKSEDKEIKRSVGFVLIRGESTISITAEAPPAPETKRQDISARGAPMARGIPGMVPMIGGGAPMGLEGPVRGISGMPQF